MNGFSLFEIFLGIWLLSGWKVFYPAVVSAVTLFFIVVFNFGSMFIVFRDISLLFTAVALAVMSYEKK